MPRFHFDIHENGRLIPDESGQEFPDVNDARKEAVLTGASIARDAFIAGSAHRVVVDVRAEGVPFLKVSITLEVQEA
ncbi:DUF6894 family protein [Bradyrhizobium commune]|uniref:DUF6894 domain-containing protein n=1 Tax=Bradyrhizobium commune TaxID=83627 RepID=A0A7S9GWW6_9BRAD|nr:hypothetical protein [Bradyrhizobium commune]QPF89190.1 hypothetical protein IC761_22030 [Bradyrhizobium commune]